MALRKISDEVYCGTNSEHYFLAENREPGRCALLNVFNLNENRVTYVQSGLTFITKY